MKLTFFGGAKTVTGSCYLVETESKKILVDCGLFQGHDQEYELNSAPFDFEPSEIDYLLLTHCHIDHSGKIPKLVKEGFRGKVIGTKQTVELCGIMLPDSGHIQEIENEWHNRKRIRAGKEPMDPLYTAQDAIDSMEYFQGVVYGEDIKLNGNIIVKFNDAGHVLGSAILEMWVNEDGVETKLVFSGDLGNTDLPLLKDPTIIENADYLLIESTYGNRLHNNKENKAEKFISVIRETISKGGNVVIPSFAVGRTQEIIYELFRNKEKYMKELEEIFSIPVYVDSPLAVSATQIFRKNLDCFDEEAKKYIENGDNPLDFPGLQFTTSVEESRQLNERKDSMIILSASGMCEAGRIKHHLKHNLWRTESTILFVGYQAPGTLGRKITDGEKKVKIFGEEISVNARIESIDGYSGHADQKGLLDWLGGFKKMPKKIFIIHGEEEAQTEFAKKIKELYKTDTLIPDRGDTYSIVGDRCNKYSENAEVKYRYLRLAALVEIEELRSKFNDLLKNYKKSLKDEQRDDNEIDSAISRLRELKDFINNLSK